VFNETGWKLRAALVQELPDIEIAYFDLEKNALLTPCYGQVPLRRVTVSAQSFY